MTLFNLVLFTLVRTYVNALFQETLLNGYGCLFTAPDGRKDLGYEQQEAFERIQKMEDMARNSFTK